MQNRGHSAEVAKYVSVSEDQVYSSMTGPAGLRGPGDSPARGQLVSLRRPGGHGANSGWVLGFCFSVLRLQMC